MKAGWLLKSGVICRIAMLGRSGTEETLKCSKLALQDGLEFLATGKLVGRRGNELPFKSSALLRSLTSPYSAKLVRRVEGLREATASKRVLRPVDAAAMMVNQFGRPIYPEMLGRLHRADRVLEPLWHLPFAIPYVASRASITGRRGEGRRIPAFPQKTARRDQQRAVEIKTTIWRTDGLYLGVFEVA